MFSTVKTVGKITSFFFFNFVRVPIDYSVSNNLFFGRQFLLIISIGNYRRFFSSVITDGFLKISSVIITDEQITDDLLPSKIPLEIVDYRRFFWVGNDRFSCSA